MLVSLKNPKSVPAKSFSIAKLDRLIVSFNGGKKASVARTYIYGEVVDGKFIEDQTVPREEVVVQGIVKADIAAYIEQVEAEDVENQALALENAKKAEALEKELKSHAAAAAD